MSEELEQLRQHNALLREHVKRLLWVEQSLYVSQLSLQRQVRQLDVLNRFAADAARLSEPTAVLQRAAEAFFEVFHADQCVGYLVREDVLEPVAALGAEGFEPDLARLSSAAAASVQASALPPSAELCSGAAFGARFPGADELLQRMAQLFTGGASAAQGAVVFLPVLSKSGAPKAALLIRLFSALGYHEEHPTQEDLPFLRLLGQQLSAALENSSLVASLSESYRKLEEAQKELLKRERLSALGELSAVIAHEVRNPLAAMGNAIAAMKRSAANGAEQSVLLRVLSEEMGRLDHMVNDMLDFARPNAPTLRPASVAELVKEAAHSAIFAAECDPRSLTIRAEEDHLFAEVDARMVRQAVMNLVLNAVQASAPGSAVEVSLSALRRGAEELARIDVADNGGGIPEADLDRIFQPFFTTRAAGTGLGLALVKRFVEAHQGEVHVSSTLGKGTTFTLLLPLSVGPG